MCSSCGTPATPSSSSGSCNPIWEAGRLPALRRSVLDSVLDSAVTFLAVSMTTRWWQEVQCHAG